MNKFIKIIICISIICSALPLAACETQYLGGSRDTRWEKDLNYLQNALPQKHVDAFSKISENNFNSEMENLKNYISKLNDDEITAEIYRITASLGDSHTSAYKKPDHVYPFEFYYFKDGIYVINTTTQYKRALYGKLLKIGDMDVEKVKEHILPLIVKDNYAMIKKSLPKYLMNADILHGLKIVNPAKSTVFTFKDIHGNIFDLKVNSQSAEDFKNKFIAAGKPDSSYPLYRQKSNLNYWYEYVENKKLLYFKYNKCEEEENESMEDFTNKMLKFMNTHPVDKFVIDMRDNPGGSDKYMNPIIQWIKSNKLNNKDRLFVITGRATFSSVLINLVQLRDETNVSFVGEETSGKPNHFGAVRTFDLPNSKISIQYSTQFNRISRDNDNTFSPDKIVEISIEDYINKRDPVLNYITNK
ncbi:S41 family peptidase [Clostridium sp. HV4-5-A1G]|uniref:S41 family peptidase n=1 Tax=Clostridium sp. HV4-5-A1G TaxID=2004595 RepID=UPI001239ABB7|nr:S41 family peptidase [Clostridium sp. HV4-5-A1G]KAA8671806.1 peptidase S41 [Clostridium sp. HV4-5-A1G]